MKIRPTEYRCLIRLDPVESKTIGGIILPDESRDRNQMAQTEATLVAKGGNAFEDWGDPIPKEGDRVLVAKYAGDRPKTGDLGDLHRLCNDKDITAILE